MNNIVIFVVCLPCWASTRRVFTSSNRIRGLPKTSLSPGEHDTLKALHALFRAFTPDAAFKPVSPGLRPVQAVSATASNSWVAERDRVKEDASRHVAAIATSAAILTQADPAHAAAIASAIPRDLVAHGHQFAILLSLISLITQQSCIKPGMTERDFNVASVASFAYGVAVVLSLATGASLLTTFGKGWEFYAHEPMFWLKMELFSIVSALSLFPTTTIAQRVLAKMDGEEGPDMMSSTLIHQMEDNFNNMFMALIFTPIFAALMAHGVGYAPWLPWQAGAAPVALTLGSLSYKNIKAALDWEDEIHVQNDIQRDEEAKAAKIAAHQESIRQLEDALTQKELNGLPMSEEDLAKIRIALDNNKNRNLAW